MVISAIVDIYHVKLMPEIHFDFRFAPNLASLWESKTHGATFYMYGKQPRYNAKFASDRTIGMHLIMKGWLGTSEQWEIC